MDAECTSGFYSQMLTRGDGSYVLSVPAEQCEVFVRVTDSIGTNPSSKGLVGNDSVEIEVDASVGSVSGVDFFLEPATTAITGTVRDEYGTPLRGMHVDAATWSDAGTLVAMALSNADGQYALGVNGNRPWNVSILGDSIWPFGYLSSHIDSVSVPAAGNQDLTVYAATAWIAGTLIGPDNQPLVDMEVMGWTQNGTLRTGGTTDINGNYRMPARGGETWIVDTLTENEGLAAVDSQTATPTLGQTVTVNFNLAPAAPCVPPVNVVLSTFSSNGTYTLRWSGSTTGGAVYQVEESVDGGPWSLVAENLTTTVLPFSGKGNGSYQYRVNASAAGYADSSWLTGSAIAVQLACAASAGITVPATSTGSYTINWSPSNTADVLYQLEERANGGSWFSFASDIGTTGYNVSAKTDGSYEYRVKVTKDGYTDSTYRSSDRVVVKQPALAPCATPGSLYVPTGSATGSYTVKWLRSATTGAIYQLEERRNGGSWSPIGSNLSNNYINLTGRTTGSYEYRVSATRDGNAPSGWKVSTPCAVQR